MEATQTITEEQTRRARQERWDLKRREIIAERKRRKEEAEADGLDYYYPREPMPREAPSWFERRDGELGETVTVPVGPAELRIPADELSLVGTAEGAVRPIRPRAAVEALAGERPAPRPAPPRSALEKTDAAIASLGRFLTGRD